MSSGSWIRPPMEGAHPATGLAIGRSVPAWALSAAALLIALAVSAPMLALNSAWMVLPVGSFVLTALRPSVGAMLLSLFLLAAGWYFSNDGLSLLTPVLVLAVHGLYVLYSVTAAVPARTRVCLPALKTLAVSFLKIQLIAQALTVLALLTEQPRGITAVSVAAAAVLMMVVGFLWRAVSRTRAR
ncbi:hypothetical protein [Arthrobacter castelli]|uniref:hypothetical protein n=1 Tax=Arthrobacter castelli TaxID=271431 RepID=UPI00040D142D|nr:hypothetical protein [Arthrobacter castelli]